MIIENGIDADICRFHLNALSSGLPLNIDVDTTLTVLAGNCYRLLARTLPRYELDTPDRLWRHFLDTTGTVTVADDHVRVDWSCALHARAHRRRIPRARCPHPLVGRQEPAVRLPAPLNLRVITGMRRPEDRG